MLRRTPRPLVCLLVDPRRTAAGPQGRSARQKVEVELVLLGGGVALVLAGYQLLRGQLGLWLLGRFAGPKSAQRKTFCGTKRCEASCDKATLERKARLSTQKLSPTP